MNDRPDISIVMPCLNEHKSLARCFATARAALAMLAKTHGLSGEIILADNGSTDGSQQLARGLGARVVHVPRVGYGAALTAGFAQARGRYLVMGDADASYDFRDCVAMVEALMKGADLCLGSRFRGGIAPGAMPWKNRYIGNPILTGILNFLFGAKVGDAHCGLRALTRRCLDRLRLEGEGMEYASEMIIKATLLGERIAEVPATLSPDLRGRPPHLRPWRDGWRHLRYILMLSPHWLFGFPAAVGIALAGAILAVAGANWIASPDTPVRLGNLWTIFAGTLMTLSHVALILALAGQLYGVRQRYRRPSSVAVALRRFLTLEGMLIVGGLALVAGCSILTGLFAYWSAHQQIRIDNVFPAVLGASLMAVGAQTILGGFLLAIIGGNAADFLAPQPSEVPKREFATEPVRGLPDPVD